MATFKKMVLISEKEYIYEAGLQMIMMVSSGNVYPLTLFSSTLVIGKVAAERFLFDNDTD